MDGLGSPLLNVEQLGCHSVAACCRSAKEDLARLWMLTRLIDSVDATTRQWESKKTNALYLQLQTAHGLTSLSFYIYDLEYTSDDGSHEG